MALFRSCLFEERKLCQGEFCSVHRTNLSLLPILTGMCLRAHLAHPHLICNDQLTCVKRSHSICILLFILHLVISPFCYGFSLSNFLLFQAGSQHFLMHFPLPGKIPLSVLTLCSSLRVLILPICKARPASVHVLQHSGKIILCHAGEYFLPVLQCCY